MNRKVFALGIAAAILVSANMIAQENRSGIRGGYLSSASSQPGTEAINGFYVGFAHDRHIRQSKVFMVHGGTEYTQAGWAITDNTYNRLHYISLTNALIAKLGPVFLQGGYALNFKVAEGVYVDGEDAKTNDNKSRIFNLPLHAGLGLMLGPVTVEARYNYGLLNVNDFGDKVGYLQLGAGFYF